MASTSVDSTCRGYRWSAGLLHFTEGIWASSSFGICKKSWDQSPTVTEGWLDIVFPPFPIHLPFLDECATWGWNETKVTKVGSQCNGMKSSLPFSHFLIYYFIWYSHTSEEFSCNTGSRREEFRLSQVFLNALVPCDEYQNSKKPFLRIQKRGTICIAASLCCMVETNTTF